MSGLKIGLIIFIALALTVGIILLVKHFNKPPVVIGKPGAAINLLPGSDMTNNLGGRPIGQH